MSNQIRTRRHAYINSAKGIRNTLVVYDAQDFAPSGVNHRLVTVKQESLSRLNETMERTFNGNAQIFETMIYKDKDRVQLIKDFWQGLKESPTFKELPEVFRELEFEQIRKVGPKSRWTSEKLLEGFKDHISLENKHKCKNLNLFEEASKVLSDYWTYVLKKQPELQKYLEELGDVQTAKVNLPNDSNSGDPYFVSVDKKLAGVGVNQLDQKLADQLKNVKLRKRLYYTMFKRVQAKGNNLFLDDGTFNPHYDDPWLPEKNRVVQGDSRAYAMLGKGIANLFTKLLPGVDPIMAAWSDDHNLNKACNNMLNRYSSSYDFKSFDAENFDATTDPNLFILGMHTIFDVVEKVGGKLPFPREEWINHFIQDPTITPWGIFNRISLPSGHIWTNLVGTVTNHLRNLVQTARLMKRSVTDMYSILVENLASYVPLFLALGDDAVQLILRGKSKEEASEEDNLDGFGSNPTKTLISRSYFHFLQKGFDHDNQIFGYYPVSRALESILFQEYANQYDSALVTVNAIAVINNCQFNPLQEYLIKFVINGDPKYRLGTTIGFKRLFKLASGSGSTLAKLLDREWDPKFAGKSYNDFGDGIKDTLKLISTIAGKLDSKS